MLRKTLTLLTIAFCCISSPSFAKNHEINFNVGYKTVYVGGKPAKAVTVNNQLPGPVLHFREGDEVTINVHNGLNDSEAAIHWHGLLLPWQMDGVLGITQHGIQPGQTFRYHYKLRQSGTYWYHSHAGLQEQAGLYGALIIDPAKPPPFHYTKDFPIVLSDWTNTWPEKVMSNLKKDGEYYSPGFPLQPSLTKFIHDYRKGDSHEKHALINDYMGMQKSRMGIYDISDVVYDAFLLNGRPKSSPWFANVKVGDVVRLRFIGATTATIFHIKMPGAVMRMVHVEGNDVKPFTVKDFTVAPGETYDVLVKIEENKPYIIYAESADTVGAAYGVLQTKPGQYVNLSAVKPFPEPLPVTRQMMKFGMASSHHGGGHHGGSMPTEPSLHKIELTPPNKADDVMTTPGTKYQAIVAAVKTNDPTRPVDDVINLELFGYMERYVWFINGVPEYLGKPIVLEPAKRYRFIFKNNTMMHHPMHVHGHWFILRKGQGSYDPLLHTLDVAPGATLVADLDTDASGQWYFHCHFLYHMFAGMARTIQYSTLIDIAEGKAKPERIIKKTPYHNRPIVRVDKVMPFDLEMIKKPIGHFSSVWLASFLELGEDPFHNVQELSFKGLYGPDYNKLELSVKDAEMNKGTIENADVDIFYWRLISQFWALKAGGNYFYRPALVPYWQLGGGIEGLTPYFFDLDIRGYYYQGTLKGDVEVSRDIQITNNFFVRPAIRSILASETNNRAQIGNGMNQMRYIFRAYYRVMPALNIFTQYEHDRNYGAFKMFQGGQTNEDTLTLGLSTIF